MGAGDARPTRARKPGCAGSGPGWRWGCYRFAVQKIQVVRRWNKLLTFNSISPFFPVAILSVFAMVSPYGKIFREKRDLDVP